MATKKKQVVKVTGKLPASVLKIRKDMIAKAQKTLDMSARDAAKAVDKGLLNSEKFLRTKGLGNYSKNVDAPKKKPAPKKFATAFKKKRKQA